MLQWRRAAEPARTLSGTLGCWNCDGGSLMPLTPAQGPGRGLLELRLSPWQADWDPGGGLLELRPSPRQADRVRERELGTAGQLSHVCALELRVVPAVPSAATADEPGDLCLCLGPTGPGQTAGVHILP